MSGKPKTVQISRSLATRFAEMTPAPQDRHLSERRIEAYNLLVDRGEFRPVTWAEAYCEETDDTYRVNGKHTSIMLSRRDSWPPMYAVVESYRCETLEDVAKLYSTFDTRLQARTTADINRAFAASVPDLADIHLRFVSVCVHGMWYHELQDTYASVQPAVRAEKILDERDFIVWAHDVIGSGNESKHVLKGPVMGAVFGSYKKAKTDAAIFWRAVVEGSGTPPTAPDRKLNKFLLVHSVGIGRGARLAQRATARAVFVKSIHAWNAWRRSEPTDLKYVHGSKVPSFK